LSRCTRSGRLTAIAEPAEIVRWSLIRRADEPDVIVLVVDDAEDDELTGVAAREDTVPSPNFDGVWGSGQKDGNWLAAFQLIQLGGGLERQWYTANLERPLLEAIVEVPHYVAIMPAEIAGDASTLADMLPRLGGSFIVSVEHPSLQVAQILAERGD
jgi:hypothetical protein